MTFETITVKKKCNCDYCGESLLRGDKAVRNTETEKLYCSNLCYSIAKLEYTELIGGFKYFKEKGLYHLIGYGNKHVAVFNNKYDLQIFVLESMLKDVKDAKEIKLMKIKKGDNVKFVWGMGLHQYKGKVKKILKKEKEAAVEITHIYQKSETEKKYVWEERENILKRFGQEKYVPMHLSVPLSSLELI